jgi:hypothetical protein
LQGWFFGQSVHDFFFFGAAFVGAPFGLVIGDAIRKLFILYILKPILIFLL